VESVENKRLKDVPNASMSGIAADNVK